MFEYLSDTAMYIGVFFLSSILAHFAAKKTVEWITSKEFWYVIVDGEPFEVVSNLEIIQKYHEIRFWNVNTQCWRHFIYSRLELYRLRRVEEADE